MTKTYWKDALKLSAAELEGREIDFRNEIILWKDAILLGKSGIKVPLELIDNDEDTIDYTQVPPITEEDIASGKLKIIEPVIIRLSKANYEYLKSKNTDISDYINLLIDIQRKNEEK